MLRRRTWTMREELRATKSVPKRVLQCGHLRYKREVELQTAGGKSGWWDGVVRCRARMCPVCWISRRAKVAREIDFVVRQREASTKLPTLLATFTVRHTVTDHVKLTRDVRACWRLLLQRRRWRKWFATTQMEWICAEEVTRGENGWHPHLHLLCMPGSVIAGHRDVAADLHEQWSAIVEQRLGAQHVPSYEHGVDLRACSASAYLTKLGLELTDAAGVKGRAPLALLEQGELALYIELQRHRTRARDITFSRGLRTLRDAMPEPETNIETLLRLRGSEWGRLRHVDPLAPLVVAGERSTEAAAATARWFIGALEVDSEQQQQQETNAPTLRDA